VRCGCEYFSLRVYVSECVIKNASAPQCKKTEFASAPILVNADCSCAAHVVISADC
jgi:hypothetical protein